MPIPTTPDKPFWLARPNIEGETRIIFQTAKRHDVDLVNAFSAHDVLLAAGVVRGPLEMSQEDATVAAITLGASHELAITGLLKKLKKRNQDWPTRIMESESALFGLNHPYGMHRWETA